MDVPTADFVGLCRSLLTEGIAVSFEANGDSMAPAILPGDRVTLAPLAIDRLLTAGDVVAFVRGHRLYVHRVTGRWSGGVLARGDRRGEVDGRVRIRDVLGLITGIERRVARPSRVAAALTSLREAATAAIAVAAARLRV